MKQLFLIISILLFLSFSLVVNAEAKEDYKQLYLEQKAQSLRIELQALQMRFNQIQSELPQALAELNEHTKAKTPEESLAQDEKDIPPKEK